jgi:hypothetical protein
MLAFGWTSVSWHLFRVPQKSRQHTAAHVNGVMVSNMRISLILLVFLSSTAFSEIIDFSTKEICVPETDDCISEITIISSSSTRIIENLMGPFYLSKENNQIFDCGGSVLRRMDSANIIEESGAKRKIKHTGSIVDCGLTKDSTLYWVAYETVSNGKWQAKLFVLDKFGQEIHSTNADFESIVEFEYKGFKYNVPIPEIP